MNNLPYRLGRFWGSQSKALKVFYVAGGISLVAMLIAAGNAKSPDVTATKPTIPLQPGVTVEQKISECMVQAGSNNDAYRACMLSADAKVREELTEKYCIERSGEVVCSTKEEVERMRRMQAIEGRFSAPPSSPPARQPWVDYNNQLYNQRLQDRVDRQDSRAMQQMQSDARFRNRMNEYNFRHGGR